MAAYQQREHNQRLHSSVKQDPCVSGEGDLSLVLSGQTSNLSSNQTEIHRTRDIHQTQVFQNSDLPLEIPDSDDGEEEDSDFEVQRPLHVSDLILELPLYVCLFVSRRFRFAVEL